MDRSVGWASASIATAMGASPRKKLSARSASSSPAVSMPSAMMVAPTSEANEIIAEIRFPAPDGRTGGAYAKFAHPASGFAITGVAAVITIKADGTVERAAIGVTGAAAAAYRATAAEKALAGTNGDAKAIAAAAAKAADGITALSDLAASSDYRKHLVTVYAKRAIERAISRAKA